MVIERLRGPEKQDPPCGALMEARGAGYARRGSFIQFQRLEAKGIGDHGDRAEAHGGGGDHGIEEPACEGVEDAGGDGDAECVVAESEEQILSDIGHDAPAEADGSDDAMKVAFDECDSGGLDGDVGSRSHRDTCIGSGECGARDRAGRARPRPSGCEPVLRATAQGAQAR